MDASLARRLARHLAARIELTRWGWLIPQRRFLGLTAFWYAAMRLLVYMD